MAVYTYQGRGSAGATAGEIEAADRTSAVGELRRRAILVTKINEKSGGKTKAKAGGKVKDGDLHAPVLHHDRRRSTPRAVPHHSR